MAAAAQQPDVSIAEPFPIFSLAHKYLLYDVNVVSYIRAKYSISGVLIGTLPQAPQQNVFSGIPLELMPEEARWLVEEGIAYLVDDVKAHKHAFMDNGLSAEEKRAFQSALRRQGVAAAKDVAKRGDDRKKVALEKKFGTGDWNDIPEEMLVPTGKRATKKGKKIGSRPTSSGGTGTNTPSGEASGAITPAVEEEEMLFGAPSGSATSPRPPGPPRSESRASSAVTASTLTPYPQTPTTSAPLLQSLPPPPKEVLPLPEVPSSYPLYKHMHEKSYFMAPGLRFGCQYMAYPGDPLRFHSHFLCNGMDWDQEFDLLDIVGGGRLGTGVKKGFLIGGQEGSSASNNADDRIASGDKAAKITCLLQVSLLSRKERPSPGVRRSPPLACSLLLTHRLIFANTFPVTSSSVATTVPMDYKLFSPRYDMEDARTDVPSTNGGGVLTGDNSVTPWDAIELPAFPIEPVELEATEVVSPSGPPPSQPAPTPPPIPTRNPARVRSIDRNIPFPIGNIRPVSLSRSVPFDLTTRTYQETPTTPEAIRTNSHTRDASETRPAFVSPIASSELFPDHSHRRPPATPSRQISSPCIPENLSEDQVTPRPLRIQRRTMSDGSEHPSLRFPPGTPARLHSTSGISRRGAGRVVTVPTYMNRDRFSFNPNETDEAALSVPARGNDLQNAAWSGEAGPSRGAELSVDGGVHGTGHEGKGKGRARDLTHPTPPTEDTLREQHYNEPRSVRIVSPTPTTRIHHRSASTSAVRAGPSTVTALARGATTITPTRNPNSRIPIPRRPISAHLLTHHDISHPINPDISLQSQRISQPRQRRHRHPSDMSYLYFSSSSEESGEGAVPRPCKTCKSTQKALAKNPACCSKSKEQFCVGCWNEGMAMSLNKKSPEEWLACLLCGRNLLSEDQKRLAGNATQYRAKIKILKSELGKVRNRVLFPGAEMERRRNSMSSELTLLGGRSAGDRRKRSVWEK